MARARADDGGRGGAQAAGRGRAARREPRSTLFRAARFLDVAGTPRSERYARLMEVFPLELRRDLWLDPRHAAAVELEPRAPGIAGLQLLDIATYLPGDLLLKADIASMAHSLELRSPFLGHDVVALGLALPDRLKTRGRDGKVALRLAFGPDLPAVVPRVIVLLHERDKVLSAFTDKSDDFALTFVHHGTFGLVPGQPSAYTQPLYGFFLVPVYWIFGREWWSAGFAQILVATATAFIVYAIGARLLSRSAGVFAAVVSTLNPYLVWHDVHLNREILDQLLAAAIVLCVLVAADRRSIGWAVAAGIYAGLAILGNVRLSALPLVLAAYLILRAGWSWAPLALIAAAAVTVAPWVVRNRAELGCYALT